MKLDTQKERADVLAAIGLVLMMGLPMLIGYGVVPYTNFGVEVVAVLGMGVLLIAGALLAKDALPSGLPLRSALSFVVMLALWTLAKVGLGPLSAVNHGTLLIYLGYMGGLSGAIWFGHVLMTTLSWPWVEKLLTRTLILAAIVAAAGSLMQYFVIDGSWMGLSPSAEPGRTYGFVRQPNHQATFLGMAMASLLYLRTRKHLAHTLWYPIAFLLVAAIVTTASRVGLMLLLLLSGLYVWASWNDGRQHALRAGVEILFMLALAWGACYVGATWFDIPFYGLSKLDRTASEGVGIRRELWSGAWDMVLQRPLTGHVIHSFMPTFMMYGYALQTRMVFENAHNLFLQMAVEFGLPVAVLSYALLGWLLCSLVLHARASDVARLTAGILLCILAYSQFEYPLWYSHFLFPFGLCVGLYLSGLSVNTSFAQGVKGHRGRQQLQRLPAIGAMVLGVSLLIGAVTANRDFYRLTPVFARFDDASLSQKIERVGSVFWFSDVLDLARYQVKETSGASMSEAERLLLLKRIGCERDEPWYQFPTIKMLAERGYVDDAKWLIYLLHDLNPKAVTSLLAYFSETSGEGVSEVVAFARTPRRVGPSHHFFETLCYGDVPR